MRRCLRIVRRITIVLLLALFLSTMTLWWRSHVDQPSIAWAWGKHSIHVSVQHGWLWTTRVGAWGDAEQARASAKASAAARPMESFTLIDRATMLEHAWHEAQLAQGSFARKPGVPDPRARQVEREAATLKTMLDGYLTRWRNGPVMVPSPPQVSREKGIVVERGTAGFPVGKSNGRLRNYTSPVAFTATGIPMWMPAALFGVVPAAVGCRIVVRRRRRKLRARRGQCPACGYDLRATPGKCPECGAITMVAGSVIVGDGGREVRN